MANEVTKLEDVIVPELFTQYVIEKTTEKSELIASGAVQNNPQLNELVNGGGTTIQMPRWNDLTGESQVWSEDDDIETAKITSHKEIATLLLRAQGWSSHDLAACLADADPMGAIASLVADWWVRDEKRIVMAILNGVFGASTMAGHVLDITSETDSKVSGKAILDAKQLMGDAAGKLTMLYMHSAVLTELQKQRLIEYKTDNEVNMSIPTYLGYKVISDDSAPVTLGTGGAKDVFTTYLLSQGCIQRGIGTPTRFVPTETERNAKKSTDTLYNRQAKVLHPKGISWVASASAIAKETPSNTELGTGTNWQLVTDAKNVGMVALKHTLE